MNTKETTKSEGMVTVATPWLHSGYTFGNMATLALLKGRNMIERDKLQSSKAWFEWLHFGYVLSFKSK